MATPAKPKNPPSTWTTAKQAAYKTENTVTGCPKGRKSRGTRPTRAAADDAANERHDPPGLAGFKPNDFWK